MITSIEEQDRWATMSVTRRVRERNAESCLQPLPEDAGYWNAINVVTGLDLEVLLLIREIEEEYSEGVPEGLDLHTMTFTELEVCLEGLLVDPADRADALEAIEQLARRISKEAQ